MLIFHCCFFFISGFQNFSFLNARFVCAKCSVWSKTLKSSYVFCLFSKGQNGALASTACTFSNMMLSPRRNAHVRCHNRHFFKTALSPRRHAHFACSRLAFFFLTNVIVRLSQAKCRHLSRVFAIFEHHCFSLQCEGCASEPSGASWGLEGPSGVSWQLFGVCLVLLHASWNHLGLFSMD
jgi:hypothetical protein